jgi:hypothetical protein
MWKKLIENNNNKCKVLHLIQLSINTLKKLSNIKINQHHYKLIKKYLTKI